MSIEDEQDRLLVGSRLNRDRFERAIYNMSVMFLVGALFVPALVGGAIAGCSSCGSSGPDTWQGPNWAGFEDYYTSGTVSAKSTEPASEPVDLDSFVHGEYLVSMDNLVGSDLIVDVGDGYSANHIKGAIPLYWGNFFDAAGNLKPASEMGQVLGEAGISPENSVVLYGDCADCNAPVAPFVFWAMRYLGHENVKVLDASIEDWNAAGKPLDINSNFLPIAVYTSNPRSSLLADYETVTGSEVQVLDARSFSDFARDRIPGAISIDYQRVLDGDEIMDGEELADLFGRLEEGVYTVVYSDDLTEAAAVWYALVLMGYDSGIYSWNDWVENSNSNGSGVDQDTKIDFVRLG